jgi:hypothetical protein
MPRPRRKPDLRLRVAPWIDAIVEHDLHMLVVRAVAERQRATHSRAEQRSHLRPFIRRADNMIGQIKAGLTRSGNAKRVVTGGSKTLRRTATQATAPYDKAWTHACKYNELIARTVPAEKHGTFTPGQLVRAAREVHYGRHRELSIFVGDVLAHVDDITLGAAGCE